VFEAETFSFGWSEESKLHRWIVLNGMQFSSGIINHTCLHFGWLDSIWLAYSARSSLSGRLQHDKMWMKGYRSRPRCMNLWWRARIASDFGWKLKH